MVAGIASCLAAVDFVGMILAPFMVYRIRYIADIPSLPIEIAGDA
jgi:hypothetical protein